VKTLTLGVALTVAAVALSPVADATTNFGNYDLQIQGRYDFHTWTWSVFPPAAGTCTPGCIHVKAQPRPVAKALYYEGAVVPVNGRYTLTVDDPFGLRCGNVYYGPTVPTHDVYSWDATTQVGTLESSFATGCNGEPGGTITYPFTLVRM
jgi:hypothetical protein